jgi:hypothetical protein
VIMKDVNRFIFCFIRLLDINIDENKWESYLYDFECGWVCMSINIKEIYVADDVEIIIIMLIWVEYTDTIVWVLVEWT